MNETMNQIQEEDIPLSELPPHLQMAILQKMEFPDFITFKKCSKYGLEMCNNVKAKLHWDVYEVHWYDFQVMYRILKNTDNSLEIVNLYIRHIIIDEDLNDERCDKLIQDFAKARVQVQWVIVTEPCCLLGNLSVKALNPFCQATKAENLLLISAAFPTVLFDQNYIKQMVSFFYGRHSVDEDFSLLNSVKMSLAELPDTPETLHRLQRFFQQWKAGSRRIKDFAARWSGPKEDFNNIALKDLQLRSIWTKSTHRTTPLATLKLWRYRLSEHDEAFLCVGEHASPLMIFISSKPFLWVAEVEDENDAYFRLSYFLKKYAPLSPMGKLMRRVGDFFRRIFRLS